jgi:hypothetical protein
MIEVVGWLSTLLVLAGYISNARGRYVLAMSTWIIGDVGWITYDIFIDNFSHLTLSLIIIGINIYGIYNVSKHCLSQKD